MWEEERRVSRYAADLPQLSCEGKRISPNPRDWRCDETGATENLWLNLSTGFIGSGRQVSRARVLDQQDGSHSAAGGNQDS